MPKPELGLKRLCVSCGTRFYDLGKRPVACPKCAAEQPADQPRARRSGNVAETRKPKAPVVADEIEPDSEADAEEAEESVLDDTSDDDDDAFGSEVEVEPDSDEAES